MRSTERAADDAVVAAGVDHRGVAGAEPAVAASTSRRSRPGGRGSRRRARGRGPGARRWSRRRAAGARPSVLRVSSSVDASRVSTPATGTPTQPGRRSPSARTRQGDHRLAHPVALDGRLAGELAQLLEHRDGQGRAAGDEQPRGAQRARGGRVGGDPRPDRRHAEEQGRPVLAHGRGVGGRGGPPDVHQPRPEPQRAEDAEHQPVDVEQGQAVGEGVVGGPLPRVGETVEARRHRGPRQQHALGRAGGPRV